LGADVNPATLDYDQFCLVGPGNRIGRFSAFARFAASTVAFLLGDLLLTPGHPQASCGKYWNRFFSLIS
jgi:hypothetical protein